MMVENINVVISEEEVINVVITELWDRTSAGVDSSYFLYNQAVTGVIDGINRIFTTAIAFTASKLKVKLNGIDEVHFIELSDTQFELEEAPLAGDQIKVDLIKKS